MIHNLNNFVNESLGSFFVLSAPNFSKTKRGANGKFLPKPLLFHLRHPNSKTNEPKFWQNYFLGKGFFALPRLIFSGEFGFGFRPQKGVWGMNAGGKLFEIWRLLKNQKR